MFDFDHLDHVVLRTARLEAMLDFYRDVMGMPVERTLEDLGLYQLRAGGSLIDIVDVDGELGRAGGPAPAASGGRNMDHFCLKLRRFDAKAIAAHLAAHGVEASDPAPRYGADGTGPSIYLRDPDGNTLELKGDPDA